MLHMLFLLASATLVTSQVLYYTFYQDPWCTANAARCSGAPGCCDASVDSKTLLNPTNWPNCSNGEPVLSESILINPLAPNRYGGIDMDFIGTYYAKGAFYYDKSGTQLDWENARVVACGGEEHDNPYSYDLPAGDPAPGPLCIPAEPPSAIKLAIQQLKFRNMRIGVSLLGGGYADNPALVPKRNQLQELLKLEEVEFAAWIVQVRAAGTVLNQWGLNHFDIDFEGGMTENLNCTALTRVLNALRFNNSIVSVTTEVDYLETLDCLVSSEENRPDLIQLMMNNYQTSVLTGIEQIKTVSANTGYPVSQFRLGVKPQCGVPTGSLSYLQEALPGLVNSSARPMLWNLGRDYPCPGTCSSPICNSGSTVGQQPFTSSDPFAFSCTISYAYNHVV